ncbi:MAG TPA: hypothetical protein VK627_09775 [Edaphobacter sp.]|nr:hypothetical protein [Edaphobacter sp.]
MGEESFGSYAGGSFRACGQYAKSSIKKEIAFPRGIKDFYMVAKKHHFSGEKGNLKGNFVWKVNCFIFWQE